MSPELTLCVMGLPIKHSLSPVIHQAFASQFSHCISYKCIAASEVILPEALSAFRGTGGVGANITAPLKKTALALCKAAPDIKAIGAVNTLSWQDGHWQGFNTDGAGWVCDVSKYLQWPLVGQDILILGAGGAALGLIAALLDYPINSITVVVRTCPIAPLLPLLDKKHMIKVITYAQLAQQTAHYDWVINAVGPNLEAPLQIPRTCFENAFVYDLSYGVQAESFCQYAKQMGAVAVVNGMGMLIEQAALSFEIWVGQVPDTQPLREYFSQDIQCY